MKVRSVREKDVDVIKVEGEVNFDTSPQLRKSFEENAGKNSGKIVIDLSGVSYIDSSGLATFIELLQKVKKSAGELKLCAMSENVRNIFSVTKVDTIFDIFDDKNAAMEAF